MKGKFVLSFMSGKETELFHAEFHSASTGECLHSVRGKTEGAFRGAGTFQWTAAVKGLVVLAIRTAVSAMKPDRPPFLEGEGDSLASSFDYAISKGPAWLTDMFGIERNGDVLAKRLFRRSNPNRKRPGPVAISINPALLPGDGIIIELDGEQVVNPEVLESISQEIIRAADARLESAVSQLKLVVNK